MKWVLITCMALVVFVVPLAGAQQDFDMSYGPRILHIGVSDFHIYQRNDSTAFGGAASIISAAGADSLLSKSAADVAHTRSSVRPIGNYGFAGWRVTRADQISASFSLPVDMDNRFGVAFRVWTFNDAAGSAKGSLRYKLTLDEANVNTALARTAAGGDSILFARDSTSSGGATPRISVTRWDTVGAASTTTWDRSGGLIVVNLAVDSLGTFVVDSTFCMGMDMAFVPKMTTGAGTRARRIEVPGPNILGQNKGTFLTRLP